jgi:hypothetical protein
MRAAVLNARQTRQKSQKVRCCLVYAITIGRVVKSSSPAGLADLHDLREALRLHPRTVFFNRSGTRAGGEAIVLRVGGEGVEEIYGYKAEEDELVITGVTQYQEQEATDGKSPSSHHNSCP